MSYKDILFHCDEIFASTSDDGIRKDIETIRYLIKDLESDHKELDRANDNLRDDVHALENRCDDYRELVSHLEESEPSHQIHGTGIMFEATDFLDIELMDTINELFFNGLTHRQIIDNLTKTQ